MIEETYSLCSTCLRTLPAERRILPEGVFLWKTCPDHGEEVTLREPNTRFYLTMRELLDPAVIRARPGVTAINTTDRCNMRCVECYHAPDYSPDPPISSIVEIALRAAQPRICLLGAESTVRKDLPELISAIRTATGKRIVLYTNGLKLADPAYLSTLVDAGLEAVTLSLHHPEHAGDNIFSRKIQALENILASPLHLNYLSCSVTDLAQVPLVHDMAHEVLGTRRPEVDIRIRVTSKIGKGVGSGLPLSALVAAYMQTLAARDLPLTAYKGSHPYLLISSSRGRAFYLLNWPSPGELDLEDLKWSPGGALLVPELGETAVLHQGHILAHLRTGGAMPKPPILRGN